MTTSSIVPSSSAAAGVAATEASGSGAGRRQKLPKLESIEAAKRAAAYAAVDRHVKPSHKIIGIGSGSTVPYVVERIIQQGPEVNAKRWFVPTGFQSKELIVQAGLNLGDVDCFPTIDVTIDGADEVDNCLNAIKGGGACHLREKVLAEAATEFVIVADYRKNSNILGSAWTQGVPIAVIPFSYAKVMRDLKKLGSTNAQLRMGKMKAGPVVTDDSCFIIDAVFSPAVMKDPQELFIRIKMLVGVAEVGIFAGMAKAAYFGNADGTITTKMSDGKVEEGVRFDVEQLPPLADAVTETS
ncbi:putative RKI1-D-ribose-5-phosphate ketol-isomerase [Tilletiaria anomala UBC 951]|uniref:Ribose-5-phosphate isomerase n=1 Tax=Tilletiaria anomala (strain ATCC 24038 / CBS 436.72 / UBC 951) TaxID=1037660 RepID=A0A066WS35_TILAU|nr:putative RKI1-D-ribose-5-phosphate ketol-isomerase [Tilletiaria anomala UBC 951]KDN53495.1 putative RKI1-D-ribose-5-phosphate ketol-isomerase [Tilletiaria anomala UBC 951]